MDVNRRRQYKTFHYGAYIMKILQNYGISFPESEFSTIKELGSKTLGLMNLPKRPQSLAFISFQEWIANRDQNHPQPHQHHHPVTTQVQERDDDEIEVLNLDSTP